MPISILLIFVLLFNAFGTFKDAALILLHSTGKANSLRGNGTLSTAAPGATEAADQYVYDPANPAPTTGGPLCCDAEHMPPGPRDQRPVEAREDVLVYRPRHSRRIWKSPAR